MSWFAVVFFVLIAILFYAKRRELAHMQAAVAGGNVLPGCAVAEAVLFLLMAVGVVIAHYRGWF